MHYTRTKSTSDARFRTPGPNVRPAPLALRRLAYILLLATLVAIPSQEAILVPGIGTVARIVGIGTFAVWAMSLMATRTMRRFDSFHGFTALLVTWIAISTFWSSAPDSAITTTTTLLQLLVLSVVIWDLCDSDRTVVGAIQALVAGMWLAAASLFFNYAQGLESQYGRFASLGADPNTMSVMMALGIPLAVHLTVHSQRRGLRLMNLLYIPAAVLVMTLTGSRGGFLAGLVAIAYLLVSVRHQRRAVVVLLLLATVAAFAVVTLYAPDTSLERIVTLNDQIAAGDLGGRAAIWQEAWDVFLEHPVTGIGAGASRVAIPSGMTVHNTALLLLLEFGVIGIGLFTLIVAAALRWSRSLTPRDRWMWWSVFGIWAVGSMSLSLLTWKPAWVMLSLVLTTTATARSSADASAGGVDDLSNTSQASARLSPYRRPAFRAPRRR